ncbi:MAG: alkyl hydroperoxide reductase subunit F [Planctomycetota bacterium]|nr:MAG: alkyl hydroperoxide reductase subunit F [Planctomycetota bacterium]
MFDSGLQEQLHQLFAPLDHDYQLVTAPSEHPQAAALEELVTSLAATSPRLHIQHSQALQPRPRLELWRDGQATGVAFAGVPNGHEFSSLVLAILNADGKGRLPDAGIVRRIRALRGPVRLRTMVSLECTNCPDVVQALNMMALLHEDFAHEMWDGAMAEDEVARLGIQGVPTVLDGDQVLHVGKADVAEILERLESHLGAEPAPSAEVQVHAVDLAVVGGGPAGVAAAIYSARKGLRVALIAARIGGQVSDTLGIENLISVPYTEGPRLASDLRGHLEASGVQVLDHRSVERLEPANSGAEHILHLRGSEQVHCSQVVMATGARWRELGVPGEKEHLGHGVAFCPHCDGPFYKGKRVAVVGGGNSGVEAAIDLAGICTEVTLFEYAQELRADGVLQRKLQQLPNVQVITGARTTQIIGNGAEVSALAYEDRSSGAERQVALDGVFVQIGLAPNSDLVKGLVECNRQGEIIVDGHGRSSHPGIYAAGDVANIPYKQIVIAMGDGAKTALAAFEDRLRA